MYDLSFLHPDYLVNGLDTPPAIGTEDSPS